MVIRTKILAVFTLAIVITIGAATALLLKMQNDMMTRAELREAEFLCGVIERTAGSAMMSGKAADIQKIIEDIGKDGGIISLRILTPEGTILRSSVKSEIGSVMPGFSGPASGGNNVPRTALGDVSISYFHSIRNRAECFGCHDSRNAVIGIIHVVRDTSGAMSAFIAMKRVLVASNITGILVVCGVLGLLFSRLVTRPLKNLLLAIHDVEAGNWNASAGIAGNDELGDVGAAFNRMIGEINRLYRKNLGKERDISMIRVELEHKSRVEELNVQLELKIRQLQDANEAITDLSKEVKHKNVELVRAVERLKKINEVGRILSSIIETRELMKIIMEMTAELIGAERVIIHLKESVRPSMTLSYARGGVMEHLGEFSFEMSRDYADLFTYGQPVFINGTQAGRVSGSRIGVPLKVKGEIIGGMLLENGAEGGSFTEDELEILTTLSNQAMVAIENAWLYESLKNNYFSTIQSLVNALEASDRFTKGHSERVRILSGELGKRMGLDFRELELLEQASILHDIGKIGIDSFILQKQGKLTAREYSLIKTHPLIGDEILVPIQTLDEVRKTIIQHHERNDGTGYPYGLRGDEISLKAKILSVVDTFDAMMTDRPYRKALSVSEVKEELVANAGTQFDSAVAEAFVKMLDAKGEEFLGKVGYNTLFSSF